ncbi:hypothetical protein ASPVEDRAFT_26418 [Aspergillus versicolor CBS 583.65]|uniref:FAD-binding domain-containing protein n=1 Tax=Aspergillus versicolor CBS 583.65 TaxID=1036611 RepID=A0A1L9PDP0_ASPVE|nr:uncharacterized protein ASPVEDRAFT_26418 [Aspergillus versicolor CBS 583.65]OJI99629.1 hypothetical protein ASPVEDRAFT_26418 [Aspergillus versicolor CBS 583.65]
MTISQNRWCCLDVGIVGGGMGGLAAAIALRRAGHLVTLYERLDVYRDTGASISCPANGSKWLAKWGVDIGEGKPITILKQIRRDLGTGEVIDVLDLSDYANTWGHPNTNKAYYNFYRVDMHRMLLTTATAARGDGTPVKIKMNHTCNFLDLEAGTVCFTNGLTAQHDLIVGADGVGSCIRRFLGIEPVRKRATSSCIHCVIKTSDVYRLGLPEMARNDALEYWGQGLHKIVYSACREGSVQSFYLFFPLSSADLDEDQETWLEGTTYQQALKPYSTLDPKLRILLTHSEDIRPWRLFEHSPYPTWQCGRTCIMGDAAHPMLPDQSQGACQAIEDAAALGVIFSREYTFTNDVNAGLQLFERIRKPRASKVQAASARARKNLSERIGFSSNKDSSLYLVESEVGKLTIEEINGLVALFLL